MGDAWKAEERIVAKKFGTSRKLLKGTNEKEDIISDDFSIDVKLWGTWSILRWYKDMAEVARERGKVALITVRKPGKRLRLGVMEWVYVQTLLSRYPSHRDNLYNVERQKGDRWRVDYWFRRLLEAKGTRGKIPMLVLETNNPAEHILVAVKLDNLISMLIGAGRLVLNAERNAVYTPEELEILRHRIIEEEL